MNKHSVFQCNTKKAADGSLIFPGNNSILTSYTLGTTFPVMFMHQILSHLNENTLLWDLKLWFPVWNQKIASIFCVNHENIVGGVINCNEKQGATMENTMKNNNKSDKYVCAITEQKSSRRSTICGALCSTYIFVSLFMSLIFMSL